MPLSFVPIAAVADPNPRDTRLLAQPATNGTHVAFVYADDLWIARLDGTDVRRLTTDDGLETNPAFSPDGAQIAFNAHCEGNTGVYLVAAGGGIPKRLTWHPGADTVQGFTPDGKRVLFTSGRAAFTGAHTQLHTVSIEGGLEEQLPIPNANQAAYSPDGGRIAYNPLPQAFQQWKQYRGARVAPLDLQHLRPRHRKVSSSTSAGRTQSSPWPRPSNRTRGKSAPVTSRCASIRGWSGRRPYISHWAMRYGDDLKTPTASIQGPKVMIIDEMAGSGGDLLPWMFRKFKVGPLIGQRTWGGLVGVLGFPVLMDGGVITAPNLAIWTPEEGRIVENEGVPPDIEVEQTPADVIAGTRSRS